MASINTIPIELLHKIVDLTVEDAIALLKAGDYQDQALQEQLRRSILIRLALVSKDFTRPSQLALWRYMEMKDVCKVGDLIEEGFGKDKVIEELDICMHLKALNGYESFNKLNRFLQGVKKVTSVTRLMFYGAELPLDEFFEMDSIQELKSIAVHGHYSVKVLLLPQTRLPSHLRRLAVSGCLKGIDDAVSASIEASSSTLVSAKLERIESSEYFGSKLYSVLTSLGPRLRKLDLLSLDDSIFSSLLPHCTSLKTLNIDFYAPNREGSFKFAVDTLGTVPKSVILESFSIKLPRTPNLVHFSSFIQLLQTSPYSRFKRINLRAVNQDDDIREGLIGFVSSNDDFMELIEKRGIVLGFGTEEDITREAEAEKQRLYQERQEELDSGQMKKKK